MTSTTKYDYDAMGYCIELSKMLHAQDKDRTKFNRLLVELYDLCGDDKYFSEWIDEDPLFIRFAKEFMKMHHLGGVPVQQAINLSYQIHCKLNKETLEDDELYVAEHKRAILSFARDDGYRPPRKGNRLLRFFRRG